MDTKIESTVRYLGIEVDDALAIAEHVSEIPGQSGHALPSSNRRFVPGTEVERRAAALGQAFSVGNLFFNAMMQGTTARTRRSQSWEPAQLTFSPTAAFSSGLASQYPWDSTSFEEVLSALFRRQSAVGQNCRLPQKLGQSRCRYAEGRGVLLRGVSPGVLDPVSHIEDVSWSKLLPPVYPQCIQCAGQQVKGFSVRVTMHWYHYARRQDASDDAPIHIFDELGQILVCQMQCFLRVEYALFCNAHRLRFIRI
jgi:hypothetical protein